MADYTSLLSPGYIGDNQLTDQLRANVCAFLDWGLMGLGGFHNVYLSDVAPYGGSPSTLRLSDDPRYPTGKVWDGYKTNWIWETGIEYSAAQPISISGIWVNNTFYPTGTVGTYGYNISYPQGRVLFNNPISSNSKVQVEYSYKMYDIHPDNVQWFRKVMQGSYRLDDPQFNSFGSGIWSILPESRIQLPAIVVEPVPNRDYVGYQLGGGQWIFQDIFMHVMGATESSRDGVLDILTYQNQKKFFLFDKNMMRDSGVYPLNQFGYLVNPGSVYPYLVNNFLWTYSIIENCTSQKLVNESQGVFRGVAKWRTMIAFERL